ncbi:S-layer homology domain-containing protein [Lachnospiraceae bacterium 46-61]
MHNAKKQLFCFCFSTLLTAASIMTVFGSTPNDIQNHWAEHTINTWISKNYISGYPDGTFRPNDSITRAEFVSLANKAYSLKEKTSISFQDVSQSHWAYNEIQIGVCADYIKGDTNNTFRPDDKVTRAEAASMIARLQKNIDSKGSTDNYIDSSNIPEWAKSAVAVLSKQHIMKGFPDGSFKAQNSMTRAEAVTALSIALQNNDIIQKEENTEQNIEQQNTITLEKNTLQNKVINGDVIIPTSMNSKQIILDHVVINGTLSILGGSNIDIKSCTISNIALHNKDVVIDADVASNIDTVSVFSASRINGDGYQKLLITNEIYPSVIIDADIQTVEVNAGVNLKLFSNADVNTLQILEEGCTIDLKENAQIDNCTLYRKAKITGTAGKIGTLTVYANGIETDIKPDELIFKENADKITYTTKETTNKKTSDSNNTTAKQRLTLDADDQGFNGIGKTYKSATITAKNASLSNTIINEDITIQQRVKNTGTKLKDVTVKGNVYIYGGRDAINIENCIIQNDIISHRSDKTPVTLSFDDKTDVSGNIIIRGNTILKGNKNTILKNVLVEQYSGRNLEIDTNIKNITFDTTAVETQLNQNKNIQTLRINTAPNTFRIYMMEGSVIDTLYADTDVEITGTGTIHKIITNKKIWSDNTITVDEISDGFISVTSIDGIPTKMYKGNSITLSAIIKPLDANKKAIRWSIEDDGDTGAILSDGNVLTAYHEGNVVLKAEIRNGINNKENFKQYFTISVEDEFADFVAVEDITMTSPNLWDIDESLVLTADITPENATHTLITWSIKDDGNTKAKIINNELNSKLAGTITVLATIEKGADGISDFTKEFKINVMPIEKKFIKVDNIILNTPTTCNAGDTLQLSATVEPTNADLKEIQWQIVNTGGTGAYIQNHTNLHTKSKGNIILSATIPRGVNGSSESYYQEFIITVE